MTSRIFFLRFPKEGFRELQLQILMLLSFELVKLIINYIDGRVEKIGNKE